MLADGLTGVPDRGAGARPSGVTGSDRMAQFVRVWQDTAVVTAQLWEKGTRGQNAFDYKLWFSDTYVRTLSGWRYGQSSRPLDPEPSK